LLDRQEVRDTKACKIREKLPNNLVAVVDDRCYHFMKPAFDTPHITLGY